MLAVELNITDEVNATVLLDINPEEYSKDEISSIATKKLINALFDKTLNYINIK